MFPFLIENPICYFSYVIVNTFNIMKTFEKNCLALKSTYRKINEMCIQIHISPRLIIRLLRSISYANTAFNSSSTTIVIRVSSLKIYWIWQNMNERKVKGGRQKSNFSQQFGNGLNSN